MHFNSMYLPNMNSCLRKNKEIIRISFVRKFYLLFVKATCTELFSTFFSLFIVVYFCSLSGIPSAFASISYCNIYYSWFHSYISTIEDFRFLRNPVFIQKYYKNFKKFIFYSIFRSFKVWLVYYSLLCRYSVRNL